jgi:hypothetical protein
VFSIDSPRSDLSRDQDDSLGCGRGESAWCHTCCQPFAIITQVPHQWAELDLSEQELQSRVSSRTTRAADLLHHTPGVGVSLAPYIRNEGWNTLQYSFMRSTFRYDTVNIPKITYSSDRVRTIRQGTPRCSDTNRTSSQSFSHSHPLSVPDASLVS